jgi:hypothetical protein
MNERIKQLANKAVGKRSCYMIEAEYIKFAGLIVKECAGIYSKIDNGNLHMGTDNYLEALHKTFRS